MMHNFKLSWKWYTFKVKELEEPVRIHETSEGMARYRVANEYGVPDMELISEIEG